MVLAYPQNCTAQHSITTVLQGKTIVQTVGKTTVETLGKTTVETLGKTTVAKWQTGLATLIEPYYLPRSMQDPVIKNHGRIRPENGTRFIPDICVIHARS